MHVWASEHEIEVDLESDGCEPAELGDAPQDVIWCFHHVDSKEGVVIHTRALYVARGKRLVKLVQIPVATGLSELVSEGRTQGEQFRVKLELRRAADGKSIELREVEGADCERGKKENEETQATTPAVYKVQAQTIGKVCNSRGSWKWSGGTLRKVPKS